MKAFPANRPAQQKNMRNENHKKSPRASRITKRVDPAKKKCKVLNEELGTSKPICKIWALHRLNTGFAWMKPFFVKNRFQEIEQTPGFGKQIQILGFWRLWVNAT